MPDISRMSERGIALAAERAREPAGRTGSV